MRPRCECLVQGLKCQLRTRNRCCCCSARSRKQSLGTCISPRVWGCPWHSTRTNTIYLRRKFCRWRVNDRTADRSMWRIQRARNMGRPDCSTHLRGMVSTVSRWGRIRRPVSRSTSGPVCRGRWRPGSRPPCPEPVQSYLLLARVEELFCARAMRMPSYWLSAETEPCPGEESG